MSAEMKFEVLLLAMIPAAAWAARFASSQLPPSGFADTEASIEPFSVSVQ